MKGKKPKILGVLMAVVLALSLSLAAVPAVPAAADPGVLEWDDVDIPMAEEDGDYVLWQWTDVGPIAISPDGEVLFAAVYDGGDWYLFRSLDGGYSWNEVADFGTTPIVDVVVAPGDYWTDDDLVYVATEDMVYESDDQGRTFVGMGNVSNDVGLGNDVITSLDVAYFDGEEELVVAVGTAGSGDPDAYLFASTWTEQEVEDAFIGPSDGVLDVLDVLLYGPSDEIIALVTTDTYPTIGDMTAIAVKMGTADFGDHQGTVWFKDGFETPVNFESYRGMLAVADDFNPSLYAGLNVIFAAISGNTPTAPTGDVFWCEPPYMGLAENAADLNVGAKVGSLYNEINFWSIAVSGNLDEASIIAGTELLDLVGYGGAAAMVVHHSEDGGASWAAASKRPTSWNMVGSPPYEAECYVISGSTAYAGTRGQDSAFSVSEDGGVSWNQRAFIDNDEYYIVEYVAASPAYDTDETMFMVTESTSENSLWKTTDGGDTWERIFSYSLTGAPALGVSYNHFNIVELAPGWPTDPGIFVFEWLGDTTIWVSPYGGTIFLPISGPAEANTISAWQVLSSTSLLIGDDAGNVWRTDNMGGSWTKPEESEIPGTAMVTSIEVGSDILVGTDDGEVFISTDEGVTFEPVGEAIPDLFEDWVFVEADADYEINNIVYAGGFGTCGVFRFEVGESDDWESILEMDGWDFEVTELKSADDGTLYASGIEHNGDMYGGVLRTVNPTAEDPDDVEWEWMDEGLPGSDDPGEDLYCWQLAVVPGSNILIMPAFGDFNGGPMVLIFEDTISGRVTLGAPADGTTSGYIMEAGYYYGKARVMLSWEKLSSTVYEFQVALDEDFGTVLSATQMGYDTVCETEGNVVEVYLPLGTMFYWRVRVIDPLMSQWSETWSFTTPLGPGAARPILENPAAGQQDVALSPVLEWSGLIDATHYELVVAEDCDWNNLVVDKTGTVALGDVQVFVITVDLDHGTSYCWKVIAQTRDAEGNVVTESPWSDIGTFTTIAEPVDAVAAPTPVWVWVVIAIGAVLAVFVIVLIMRTRKPV